MPLFVTVSLPEDKVTDNAGPPDPPVPAPPAPTKYTPELIVNEDPAGTVLGTVNDGVPVDVDPTFAVIVASKADDPSHPAPLANVAKFKDWPPAILKASLPPRLFNNVLFAPNNLPAII
jgi:hypothetical protein